jgi:hypothetical protein
MSLLWPRRAADDSGDQLGLSRRSSKMPAARTILEYTSETSVLLFANAEVDVLIFDCCFIAFLLPGARTRL